MVTVMGYDPGSVCAGLAVQVDGEPQWIGAWKPTKKSLPTNDRMHEFDAYCGFLMSSFKPDVVTVEVIRVGKSHDVTRVLSRFEGTFINRAMWVGAHVIEYQVGQSRAAFFGEGLGTLQKEQAYAAMRSRYPGLAWLEGDDGGMDQADALVPALCWEQIEARKRAVGEEKKARRARRRAKLA